MTDVTSSLAGWVADRVGDDDIVAWTAGLLEDLCRIDTTLGPDLDRLRHGEAACFDVLRRALARFLPPGTEWHRVAVPEALADHPAWTAPTYAGPLADDVAAVYADRANLLVDPAPEAAGPSVLVDAHVDTVPPHVPLTVPTPGRYAGRGTADDKGSVVAGALALRLLQECGAGVPVRLLVSIDEEMGGNGSLAAVEQLDLSGTSVVVMEPTSLHPHPANRGAVWFSVRLCCEDAPVLADAFAEVTLALAATGRALREASRHPMFSADDVSFCLGILDDFGDHPASACTSVTLRWPDGTDAGALDEAVAARFCSASATGDLDHRAAAPSVDSSVGVVVTTHAIGGHMGSDERDHDAIVKAAHAVAAARDAGLGVPTIGHGGEVHLEGGQGFLPDRPLADVTDRLRSTVASAVRTVAERHGLPSTALQGEISFEKLRNDAYASRSDADLADRLAEAVGVVTGSPTQTPRGWRASCDARLFARRCDEVVTFGPGALAAAHRPEEHIELSEILHAAAALVIALGGGRS